MAETEQRLIDATKIDSVAYAGLEYIAPNDFAGICEYFKKQLIDDQPTVDAVEVIRCRDCEKWDGNHYCERANVVDLPEPLQRILYQTNPDDFCSKAVRRANNDTEQQTAVPAC